MSTKKELLTAAAANVTITIPIAAPLERTWNTMINDIAQWWRKDFLVCTDSQGMRLDPQLGGRLYETRADGGGLIWGSIISFQPPTQLTYVGQIIPPWGGPAQSVIQITLSAAKDGDADITQLELQDSLVGHVTEDLVESLDEGWRQLFGEGGLKSYVESN